MSAVEGNERQEVYFSGRVQGVGFRFTAREIAEGFAVAGYVENLPDGRVHLVAEGPPAEVSRLIQAIEKRMSRNIRNKQADRSPASGEFDGFEIRH